MRWPAFLRENPRLAFFALLAIAGSGFGQTYFVSVFGSGIRDEFGLTHTAYGGIYSAATLLSALLLLRLGPLVDDHPLHRVATWAVLILATGALVTGLSQHVLMLGAGFLLLRLGGQGLLGHVGFTAAGRYFVLHRGKALAFTAAGFPLAEAVLPASAALLIGLQGWRAPWLAAVALLLVFWLPVLVRLSRGAPMPEDAVQAHGEDTKIQFTRAQTVRDPGFYLLLPGALAVPFTVTALLFHQAALGQAQGWTLELMGAAFTGFAIGHLAALFAGGPLVDRIGAQRALAVALLPLVAGQVVLATLTAGWAAFLYLGLTGISAGATSPAAAALWPERYGTRHLGAIRSLAQAAMVLSTAASPVLLGTLLDLGLTPTLLGAVLGTGVVMASLLALVAPKPVPPEAWRPTHPAG